MYGCFYRTSDSFPRYGTWRGMCVLYEKRTEHAGAMLYVVVEELIPEMSSGEHSNIGVLMFSFGFTVMMALDVALG